MNERLLRLASNLLWCWTPWYRDFLRSVDPASFDHYENPVKMVRELAPERLAQLEADADFQKRLEACETKLEQALKAALDRCPADLKGRQIAYFSAEYGIHGSLPIYSGGLGVLSGDHIKSSHDLGLPFTGVGLMYRQGYFGQRIDASGQQHADMVHIDLNHLPVTQLMDDSGQPLTVSVELPGRDLELAIWEVRVGNSRLILLDADLPGNAEKDRSLTWQLYGGDRDTRMAQEIILGIGGVRALRLLGVQPDVWHMNEGHSAFLAVERVREYLGQSFTFEEAVEAVASSTVFTTHTPVPAGNEAFILPRLHHYFRPWCEKAGIEFDNLLELGTLTEPNGYKFFSLTALAIRLSRFANGVSKLHGEVSRGMWYHLWHQVPIDESPIGHVTNGIHTGSWLAPGFRAIYEEAIGEDWEQKLCDQEAWEALRTVDPARIWNEHRQLKASLVEEIRRNLRQRFAGSNVPVEKMISGLRPNSLFVCFARRFATYKRALLIFDDLERLDRIVNHPDHPVTFVFAGKAHPADIPGQALIRKLHEISLDPRFMGRVILLEGYSIGLARYLVQGADVWLNNPRRPLEASGTSGQKVCPNGGINFSVPDGWWVEGFNGENGWNIGGETDYGDEKIQDYYDVRSFYRTLEEEIVPMYYSLNGEGYPTRWVDCMVESMVSCTARFSTSRMVSDYVSQYYVPACHKRDRASKGGWKGLKDFIAYKNSLSKRWYHMTDTWLKVRRENECVDFDAGIYLGLMKPEEVRVELFIRDAEGIRTVPVPLKGPAEDDGVWNFNLYYCDPALRNAELKLRVLPHHDYLDDDMELGICYWFHSKVE